jgi:hypothetical protein
MAFKQLGNRGHVPSPIIQQQHVGAVTGSIGHVLSHSEFIEGARFFFRQGNP